MAGGRGRWQIAGGSQTGACGPEREHRRTGEGERYHPVSRLTHVLMEHAVLHPR